MLIAVAAVGAVLAAMLLWFIAAVFFRRRFQFGIGSLLVLAVAVALPCSWLAVEMKTAREQEEVVEAIEKLRGTVMYDWQSTADFAARSHARPQANSWLRSLLGDHSFSTIVHVSFYNSQVTDTDLGYCLGRLPNLRSLSLVETPHLTDASFQYIKALSEIKGLYLCTWTVTDATLKHVADLPQLEELHLGGSMVTNAGLDQLRALPHLKFLVLDGSEVTDARLRRLGGLPQLQCVELRATEVTDEGVKRLRQALPTCKIIDSNDRYRTP